MARPRVDRTIQQLRVRLPPFEEQQTFVRMQRSAWVIGDRMNEAAQSHSELFDSLAQRAFGGEQDRGFVMRGDARP